MSIDTSDITGREDPPLTRQDVERMLQEAGSSYQLNFNYLNLRGIDLSHMNLSGARMYRTHLELANLSSAILHKTVIDEAHLHSANLNDADLSEVGIIKTDMSLADLKNANLSGANLAGTNLSGANLCGASLRGAVLRGADLREAILRNADLSNAELYRANLSGADLNKTDLHGIKLTSGEKKQLYGRGALGLDERKDDISSIVTKLDEEGIIEVIAQKGPKITISIPQDADTSIIPFRITEEPLTPYNLATILMALTELYTKYWLVAKGRYADLIEYTQTRDARFAKDTGMAIAWATYNSPFNFGFQVDKFVPSAEDALITVVDGFTQRKARLKKADLENEARAQEIKQAEQKAAHEQQMATLEREQKRIEIEQQRLSLIEQRLDLEKKSLENARELANIAAAVSSPNIQIDIQAMIVQSTMNNILQLQNATGLELALPAPKMAKEK